MAPLPFSGGRGALSLAHACPALGPCVMPRCQGLPSATSTSRQWRWELSAFVFPSLLLLYSRIRPSYLCDSIQLYTPTRTRRSASDTFSLRIPITNLSTVGSRSFSTLALLPGTSSLSPSDKQPFYISTFKSNLKSALFP